MNTHNSGLGQLPCENCNTLSVRLKSTTRGWRLCGYCHSRLIAGTLRLPRKPLTLKDHP